MPFSRRSLTRRAALRILAILLLASGGFPVGNAGNARQPVPDAPASAVVARTSV